MNVLCLCGLLHLALHKKFKTLTYHKIMVFLDVTPTKIKKFLIKKKKKLPSHD